MAYLNIVSNPIHLTPVEAAHIKQAAWFQYIYGVGLIYLSNGSWDCSDSVSALEYLRQLGIKERT